MPVDPAFAAILADRRMALREPPPTLELGVLRRAVNAFMGAADGPDVHSVTDHEVATEAGALPLRLYRPTPANDLPLILFLHGGGFVFGDIETHDAMCRTLAMRSGAAVASVGYRLVPDVLYPEPLEDCIAALGALRRGATDFGIDGERIALAGDSAGGQLAIATALSARDAGIALRHLALLYPVIDPACGSASQAEFAKGFMLEQSFIRWFWRLYGAGLEAPLPDTFNVASADLAGLPPITIVTAEYDPLRDEGEQFAARAQAAGASVAVTRFTGMIHGFAGMPDVTAQADVALHQIAAACARAFAH